MHEGHLHTVMLPLKAAFLHGAQVHIKTTQQGLAYRYAQRRNPIVHTQQTALHRLVATHQLVSCMHVTVACAVTQHHGIAHLGLLGVDVRPQQIHCIHLGAPFRGIYYHQRVGHCPLAMLVRRHQQAVYTRFQHRHRHLVERQPLALHAGIKHPFLHWPVPHILFLTGICRQRETLAELLAADCMAYASKQLRVRKQRAFGLPQPLDAEDDIPLHRSAVDVAILVFHTGQLLQLF